MFVRTIGKTKAKFRIPLPPGEQRKRLNLGRPENIVLYVLENFLSIPRKETKSTVGVRPADRIPILLFTPILMTHINMQKQVVDVLIHFQEIGKLCELGD